MPQMHTPIRYVESDDAPSLDPVIRLRRWAQEAGIPRLDWIGSMFAGALLGWLAFFSDGNPLGIPLTAAQRVGIAGLGLVGALNLWAGQTRLGVAGLFFGWSMGAGLVIPSIWDSFFGSGVAVGTLVLVAWAALMALPFLLAPRSKPWVGVAVGLAFGVVSPIGMIPPLIVSGAVTPGAGLLGVCLVAGVMTLAAYGSGLSKRPAASRAAAMKRSKLVSIVLVLACLVGGAQSSRPEGETPEQAIAISSLYGPATQNLREHYNRQSQLQAKTLEALEYAKVIVLPEAANPVWSKGQAAFWEPVAKAARDKGAVVLLGVYETPVFSPRESINALVDIAGGGVYAARLTQPASMWRPWDLSDDAVHYPAALSWEDFRAIETSLGPAMHLLCYEELLLWPGIIQEVRLRSEGRRAALMVSAANQWFTNDSMARPQMRAAAMMGRIWGLPHLRAVNWKPLDRPGVQASSND